MHTHGAERPGPLHALSTEDLATELGYAQQQRWENQRKGREVDADCWDRRTKRILAILRDRQQTFAASLLHEPPDAAA